MHSETLKYSIHCLQGIVGDRILTTIVGSFFI